MKIKLNKKIFGLIAIMFTLSVTQVFAIISPKIINVTATPQMVNGGDTVLIKWDGSYPADAFAEIVFERPSTCSIVSGRMICTMDIQYQEIGKVQAFLNSYRWTTPRNYKPIAGDITVSIKGSEGRTKVQVNPTPGYTDSSYIDQNTNNYGKTDDISSDGPPVFDFVATCKKTTPLAGESAHFAVTYIGGQSPYDYTWLDNGKEVPSLKSITSPGIHRISVLATDSGGQESKAFCGNVTLGGDTTVQTVSNNSSTVSGSCLDLRDNLKKGNFGTAVTELQKFLKSKGYFNDEATGYFGSLTSYSVILFQRANNIEGTGFVGPLTRAKIKSSSCNP